VPNLQQSVVFPVLNLVPQSGVHPNVVLVRNQLHHCNSTPYRNYWIIASKLILVAVAIAGRKLKGKLRIQDVKPHSRINRS